MKTISECMIGGSGGVIAGRSTLQRRIKGMNSVRRRDIARIFFPDQTSRQENEQLYRPRRSPMPKAKKWTAVNSKGWMPRFTGCTRTVIAGKTAWLKTLSVEEYYGNKVTTYGSDSEYVDDREHENQVLSKNLINVRVGLCRGISAIIYD